MKKDPHRYDNLIDHPRPRAKSPMSELNRAAQFAPFAALTGYDGQVRETARLTDRQIELSEGEIAEIDRRLNLLQSQLNTQPEVTITFFIPDSEIHLNSKKTGGVYETHTGTVKKINTYTKTILFTDLTCIQIERIIQVEGEIFNF